MDTETHLEKTETWKENSLLRHLNETDAALIVPHLRILHVDDNTPLYNPGAFVETVYFPCGNTLVSFMIDGENGSSVEILLVGREGAVGGIVSEGNLPAYSRILVQFSGMFLTLPVTALENAKLQSRSLNSLFARYADCLLAQIFQATACNALHTIEQRTCKWIIAAIERTGETQVLLTQERLASLLGVGRSYVSRVIKNLKQDQIVSIRRGRIEVLNFDALKQRACHCNETVKDHFDAVLKGLYPDLAPQ